MAQRAYTPDQSGMRSPRSVEYEAFARVTRRLRSAAREEAGHGELIAALHENRKLWNFMAAAVADPGNQLAPDLRARLFHLAQFTTAHSRKVADNRAGVDALVEINTAIMRGLRDRPGTP